MKPISDWCSHEALFFDNNGYYLGRKKIRWKDRVFDFKDRKFNFLPNIASHFKLKYWTKSVKYYIYNYDDPMPYRLDQQYAPIVHSATYKDILDSDLIRKLNDLPKQGLLDFLMQPKVLIVLAVIIGATYYFATGGTVA